MSPIRIALICSTALVASACGGSQPADRNQAAAPPAQSAQGQFGSVTLSPQTVDTAAFTAEAVAADARTPTVLRAQILLDRARFSPGVIDGKPGENVRQAVAAFEEANGLPVDGVIDQAVFDKLTQTDAAPALRTYTVTAEDVKGPFVTLGDDMTAQSKLPAMGYERPAEAIAEKFHMTEELLAELNPGVDLNSPGASIVVADVAEAELPAKVARIEVDKAERAVKAFDAKGQLLAFFPATIGSEERPAPSGELKVRAVAHKPTYTFDPKRLTYKQPGVKGKLTLPPGPNSPVGSVWIDLTEDTFGIHGADDPKAIGKKFSHGCVRLTNWDAEALAAAVKPGVRVQFLEAGGPGSATRSSQSPNSPARAGL